MAIESPHYQRASRRYAYVGPVDIKARSSRGAGCKHVACAGDVKPLLKGESQTTFTFVIDTIERLWVADRRSEHVACADGQDVLAAGEITLERLPNGVVVSDITNQSTGYCPEPACWRVVAQVLDRIGLLHPPHFTHSFEFRRCEKCQSTNLVKDSVFECAVCGAALSRDWNYG